MADGLLAAGPNNKGTFLHFREIQMRILKFQHNKASVGRRCSKETDTAVMTLYYNETTMWESDASAMETFPLERSLKSNWSPSCTIISAFMVASDDPFTLFLRCFHLDTEITACYYCLNVSSNEICNRYAIETACSTGTVSI